MTKSPDSATLAAVSLASATKSFRAVVAPSDGTIGTRKGASRTLVGENCAGKSTLVKVLAGVQQSDSGHFQVTAMDVTFKFPAGREAAGSSLIHQARSPARKATPSRPATSAP